MPRLMERISNGALIEPVAGWLDTIQVKLLDRRQPSLDEPLTEAELKKLPDQLNVNNHLTQRAIYQLALKTNDQPIIEETVAIIEAQNQAHARQIRRAAEVAVFGMALPLVCSQVLPHPFGMMAYLGIRWAYFDTISQWTLQARDQAGSADQRLANQLIKIASNKQNLSSEQLIDLYTNTSNIDQAIISQHNEWMWGLAPEGGIAASYAATGEWFNLIGSAALIGLYRGFNKILPPKTGEQKVARAGKFQTLLKVTNGLLSAAFGSNLVEAIAVTWAADQLSQCEMNLALKEKEQGQQQTAYQRFNRILMDTMTNLTHRQPITVFDTIGEPIRGFFKDNEVAKWVSIGDRLELAASSLKRFGVQITNLADYCLTIRAMAEKLGISEKIAPTIINLEDLLNNISRAFFEKLSIEKRLNKPKTPKYPCDL